MIHFYYIINTKPALSCCVTKNKEKEGAIKAPHKTSITTII